MDDIRNEIKKIAPTTRFIALSSIGVSLISFIAPAYVGMHTKLVFPQLWRLYTGFFILPRSISAIFDFVILYRTSSDLEGSGTSTAGAVYAWNRIVDATLILLLNIPINAFSLFRPLFVSIIYTQSLISPNATVNLFGLVSIPHYAYPYVILLIDMVSAGPVSVLISLTGIIATHFRQLLSMSPSPVPPFIKNIVNNPPSWFQRWWIAGDPKERKTSYGTAINPKKESTHNWGSGRRLAD